MLLGLTKFGNAFLNKFEASQLPSKVLEHMTIVDTPGILSGEKQRLQVLLSHKISGNRHQASFHRLPLFFILTERI